LRKPVSEAEQAALDPIRVVEGVPSYLVETYLARSQAGERAARERRARSAAEELTREKTSVRFESSITFLRTRSASSFSPRHRAGRPRS
jgi:hypothetical protein